MSYRSYGASDRSYRSYDSRAEPQDRGYDHSPDRSQWGYRDEGRHYEQSQGHPSRHNSSAGSMYKRYSPESRRYSSDRDRYTPDRRQYPDNNSRYVGNDPTSYKRQNDLPVMRSSQDRLNKHRIVTSEDRMQQNYEMNWISSGGGGGSRKRIPTIDVQPTSPIATGKSLTRHNVFKVNKGRLHNHVEMMDPRDTRDARPLKWDLFERMGSFYSTKSKQMTSFLSDEEDLAKPVQVATHKRGRKPADSKRN